MTKGITIWKKTYGADTEIDNLEVCRAEDVETLVDDTTLLSGLHGAGTERVPCGLNVVSDPVVDGLVVLFGVLKVFVNLGGVIGIARHVPRA